MEADTFDSKLKEVRLAAKRSVPEVSAHLTALGYKASEKTIYSWESGRSRPTIDIFLEMCAFYGLNEILPVFGYSKEKAPPDLGEAKHEAELLDKYRQLTLRDQAAVDTLVDYWLKNPSE